MVLKSLLSPSGRQSVITSLPALALAVSGCLPKFLDKYRTQEPVAAQSQGTGVGEGNDEAAVAPSSKDDRAAPGSSRPLPHTNTEAITVLDRNTFLIRTDAKDVWDATLTILLKNYNLNIVNKEAGIITTEWDSFYLKERVFRNKLSVRVKPLLKSEVEVTIYNNVEELKEPLRKEDATAGVWLPSDQGLREIGRVVQNLAISLDLGNPLLPADMMMAKSDESDSRAN